MWRYPFCLTESSVRTSNLTSWERNDNYYFTATDIHGPWEKQGMFYPEGSLTCNSQCTFVFPVKHGEETIPMYMGDRWSYPHQASAATYVWLPMTVEGTKLSIPEYWECWNVADIAESEIKGYVRQHNWTSDKKGESISIPFHGKRITICGNSDNTSGYARVKIIDSNENTPRRRLHPRGRDRRRNAGMV